MTDPSRVQLRCPTCKKICEPERPDPASGASATEPFPFRPFCSRRCKLADLGRWLDEDYRISRPIGPDDHE